MGPVKPFQYVRDSLFLGCICLYASNRWLLGPHTHSLFFRGYFDDILLIPCALPPLLLMQRLLHLRKHDRTPEKGEILLYLALWSVLFEWIGPHWIARATGDIWDVIAYSVGAVIAAWWWGRSPQPSRTSHGL